MLRVYSLLCTRLGLCRPYSCVQTAPVDFAQPPAPPPPPHQRVPPALKASRPPSGACPSASAGVFRNALSDWSFQDTVSVSHRGDIRQNGFPPYTGLLTRRHLSGRENSNQSPPELLFWPHSVASSQGILCGAALRSHPFALLRVRAVVHTCRSVAWENGLCRTVVPQERKFCCSPVIPVHGCILVSFICVFALFET